MIRKIVVFFDVLEDKIRAKLSHYPIVYALIGGVGIILFWRGIWHFADDMSLGSVVSILIGLLILLLTGVFISAFIGNRLIISGLKGEKKLAEKTEKEIEGEESKLKKVERELDTIETHLEHIEKKLNEK